MAATQDTPGKRRRSAQNGPALAVLDGA